GGSLADYPKMGNSPHFLLIGVNIFGNGTTSDVDWISKGSVGPNPISTCPPQSQFLIGKKSNIRNADGSQMFTPVAANNTEPGLPSRPEGWIVGTKPTSGNFLTVYGVTPTPAGPHFGGPMTVPVPTYSVPPTAPHCTNTKLLDTLDGRLEHAVASFDPLNG